MFSLYLCYYGTISLLHYYGTMSLRTSIKTYSKEVKNKLNDFTCSVFTNITMPFTSKLTKLTERYEVKKYHSKRNGTD